MKDKNLPEDQHIDVKNPATMPYPTHVGSPAFTVPDVLTKAKERGVTASHQLQSKFDELAEKYFQLVQLAEDTELMYNATCNIIPVVGGTYHLYKNKDKFFISIIAPQEWSMEHYGSFKLTSEHTWERINEG